MGFQLCTYVHDDLRCVVAMSARVGVQELGSTNFPQWYECDLHIFATKVLYQQSEEWCLEVHRSEGSTSGNSHHSMDSPWRRKRSREQILRPSFGVIKLLPYAMLHFCSSLQWDKVNQNQMYTNNEEGKVRKR